MNNFWLWTVCLALTPLAVCPKPAPAQAPVKAPPPAAPVLTGPVTHISIVGLKNISADTVQAKLTLKVGDAYTPEAPQKDAAAIQSIGVFNGQVTVAATPASPNGVDLAYTVSENPVIQSIHITANTPSGQPSVPAADLIAQMKTRSGQVLNTNILVGDLDGMFNHTNGYVTKQGYLFNVSSDINIDPKTGVLAIPLVEAHIKSIEITGNSRIKTADILAQMHTKPGDLYNVNILQNDAVAIYEMGEFKQVEASRMNRVGPGKINITIPVIEQRAATGVLDEKQEKVIPFLYDPLSAAFPVVQVSVNGHKPLPFVVDTGTTVPLLAPWAAKELGLSASGREEKANNFTYLRVPVKSFVLQGAGHDNDAALNTQEALVTDLSIIDQIVPRPHIAGVIGVKPLMSATSRFDFSAKTLTIFTAPHLPLSVLGATVLPLRANSYSLFTAHAVLAPGTSADLILDTGCVETQIPLSALDALHPTAIAFSNFVASLDRISLCPELKLPIRLGTSLIPDVTVGTLPPPANPSLGLDVLASYRMTLDGPNAQMILEPSTQGKGYTLGHSGVSVKQSGDAWALDTFKPGSPAQSAGLKAGDKIVSVNGVSVAGTPEIFCLRLIDGLVGHQVQVSVQRGTGKPIAFSWIAVDGFHALPTAIDGLPMQKPNGGSWVISQVMQSYPGDKAGLLAGDKLIKMDGEATATMSLKRFVELTSKSSVLVEVERPGVAQPFSVRLTAPK